MPVEHLVHDLARRQLPPEARLAGRAERACHGAPGLELMQIVVRARGASAGRVAHENRLDALTVGELVDGLGGQPPSAPMTWLSTIVGNEIAHECRAQRAGRSVTSSKTWLGAMRSGQDLPGRYAGSPRAVSHAASGSVDSLIAGSGRRSELSHGAEDQEGVVQERQQRGQRAGDVRPCGGLEDLASAVLRSAGHAEAVDERQGLARGADLDRQRREVKTTAAPKPMRPTMARPGSWKMRPAMTSHGRDAGAELRRGDDRLPEVIGSFCCPGARGHLVADDRGCGHRQARRAAGSRPSRAPWRRRPGCSRAAPFRAGRNGR